MDWATTMPDVVSFKGNYCTTVSKPFFFPMPRNHIRICFETIVVRIHSRFKKGDAFLKYVWMCFTRRIDKHARCSPIFTSMLCVMGHSTATSLKMLRNKSQHCWRIFTPLDLLRCKCVTNNVCLNGMAMSYFVGQIWADMFYLYKIISEDPGTNWWSTKTFQDNIQKVGPKTSSKWSYNSWPNKWVTGLIRLLSLPIGLIVQFISGRGPPYYRMFFSFTI